MKIKHLVKEDRYRVFIENDMTFEKEKFQFEPYYDRDFFNYFDVVFTNANNRQDELIELLNKSDDIYISTGFIGNSGELMNKMLQYVINNKIEGKRLFNLRKKDFIYHNRVDSKLLKKAFEHNDYYIYSDNYEEMTKFKFN